MKALEILCWVIAVVYGVLWCRDIVDLIWIARLQRAHERWLLDNIVGAGDDE